MGTVRDNLDLLHEHNDEDLLSVLTRLQSSKPRSRTSSRASAADVSAAREEALSRISLMNSVAGLRPHPPLSFTLDTEVGFGGQNLAQTDRQVRTLISRLRLPIIDSVDPAS